MLCWGARRRRPGENRVQARLIEWVEIAPGVRHLVFEAPQLERLDFVPGQFVSLTDTVANRAITRAYSIASPPGGGNRFEVCLNRVQEGAFSPHLFELLPGDVVEMPLPLGTFTLRQPLRDSLLVATGTGIAPFRSMLKAVLAADSPAFTAFASVPGLVAAARCLSGASAATTNSEHSCPIARSHGSKAASAL